MSIVKKQKPTRHTSRDRDSVRDSKVSRALQLHGVPLRTACKVDEALACEAYWALGSHRSTQTPLSLIAQGWYACSNPPSTWSTWSAESSPHACSHGASFERICSLVRAHATRVLVEGVAASRLAAILSVKAGRRVARRRVVVGATVVVGRGRSVAVRVSTVGVRRVL